MELGQDAVAEYARDLHSRQAAAQLLRVFEQNGFLEAGAATAGGSNAEKRIRSAARWDEKKSREVFRLYQHVLNRDVWLSSVLSVAYILLIVILTGLVALIAYQIIRQHFSYRQLVGLPLPLLIQLLFRAQRHERDAHHKMRADLARAAILAT